MNCSQEHEPTPSTNKLSDRSHEDRHRDTSPGNDNSDGTKHYLKKYYRDALNPMLDPYWIGRTNYPVPCTKILANSSYGTPPSAHNITIPHISSKELSSCSILDIPTINPDDFEFPGSQPAQNSQM